MLFLDFETRSTVDLGKCGADVYSKHPSTEILCMGYAFDEGPIEIWTPKSEEPFDVFLFAAVEREDVSRATAQNCFIAHNAAFEISIWNHVGVTKYGFPPVRTNQFMCTLSMAYAMALPGKLEGAAAALGIENGKDIPGHRLMLQLAQPRDALPDGTFTWWEDDQKFERLYQYCRQDVAVEREIFKRLMKLSDEEQKVWLLDQEINSRGIQVDLKAVNAAIELVKSEKNRLDSSIRHITNNAVATCTATAQLTNWLRFRGVELSGVAKSDVATLLEKDGLPDDCRSALLLRQEAAKTSTAKLEMMRDGVGSDGRIRGLTQYHGASTGRFAGRRIQVHNFPRPKISQDEIENVFEILEAVE